MIGYVVACGLAAVVGGLAALVAGGDQLWVVLSYCLSGSVAILAIFAVALWLRYRRSWGLRRAIVEHLGF